MIKLAGHDLQALEAILGALVPWKHDRVEIVILCCDLLQRVAKHTSEQPLVRSVVYLLCRLAFRRPISGTEERLDLLNLRTINRLHAFIQDGDENFIGDLMSFFAQTPWSEGLESYILQAILKIPDSGLSARSQAAINTMLGTGRWSLVEGFDRKELVHFVGRLQTDMIVQRVIGDESIFVGWMRILLLFTFRPPPDTDTRPLWKVLLPISFGTPGSFSRDLPNYIDPLGASVGGLEHDYGSEMYEKRQEALWMRLFWSSRFFEMDCKPWSGFIDATEKLRRPGRRSSNSSRSFALVWKRKLRPVQFRRLRGRRHVRR